MNDGEVRTYGGLPSSVLVTEQGIIHIINPESSSKRMAEIAVPYDDTEIGLLLMDEHTLVVSVMHEELPIRMKFRYTDGIFDGGSITYFAFNSLYQSHVPIGVTVVDKEIVPHIDSGTPEWLINRIAQGTHSSDSSVFYSDYSVTFSLANDLVTVSSPSGNSEVSLSIGDVEAVELTNLLSGDISANAEKIAPLAKRLGCMLGGPLPKLSTTMKRKIDSELPSLHEKMTETMKQSVRVDPSGAIVLRDEIYINQTYVVYKLMKIVSRYSGYMKRFQM